jgi:hypothetical protein
MATRARQSDATTFAYGAFGADEDYAAGEFFAGERICPPRGGRGGNAMLRAYVVIFIALGVGWALLTKQSTWQEWASAVTEVVSPLMDRITPAVAPNVTTAATEVPAKSAAPDPAPSSLQPLESNEVAAPQDEAVQSVPQAPPTAATPAAANGSDESQALPPPSADPADPYQMRASAVGLHPDLSRVLLAKLSSADYRNAGIAIQTAVAKTPDNGVFIWPRQRKPNLALFEVHFVPGAAPDCRRYVVTVTKDGWSTTALPMEKCGLNPAARRSG